MRCAPKPPLQLWHDLAALREGGQQGFKPPFGCPTQIAWSEFGHACPLGTERGNFGVDRSQKRVSNAVRARQLGRHRLFTLASPDQLLRLGPTGDHPKPDVLLVHDGLHKPQDIQHRGVAS